MSNCITETVQMLGLVGIEAARSPIIEDIVFTICCLDLLDEMTVVAQQESAEQEH